jgi:hypothetical protein
MQHPVRPAKRRRHPAGLLAFCVLMAACDSPPPPEETKPAATAHAAETHPPLAAARVELAKARLAAHAPDEALVLLVSALEADQASTEAAAMTREILTHTRWHQPQTVIRHPLPVDRIDFSEPSTLWVSLAGDLNTTLRWDLETLAIKSVLFPAPETKTRSLVFDPTRQKVVVERAGVALLCDAQALKPIRDIGPLPEFVTPSSTVVFSPNGLLLAHPAYVSETDRSLVWRIRDTNSGEIVRSSEPISAAKPKPLAAVLDSRKLRVLHSDFSLLNIPVSPVEDIIFTPPETPAEFSHAHFSADGRSALDSGFRVLTSIRSYVICHSAVKT